MNRKETISNINFTVWWYRSFFYALSHSRALYNSQNRRLLVALILMECFVLFMKYAYMINFI